LVTADIEGSHFGYGSQQRRPFNMEEPTTDVDTPAATTKEFQR